MKTALYIAAPILCGLSAFCSVLLWVSEQSSVAAMVLFGGFALGLELCKFAFFPVAAKLKGILSAGLYLVALALLLLSIAATVSMLETGAINSMSQARADSDSYQAERFNVESLTTEIKTLQTLIEKDLANGYRQRALSQSQKLKWLRNDKAEAVALLNSLDVTPLSGVHSIFGVISKATSSEVAAVRFWVYLIAAIIIDVCGILCLLLISSDATKPLQDISPRNEEKTNHSGSVKDDIAAGMYGEQPVMTKVMKQAGIRHPKAKEIFQALLSDGILKQNGRSYQLVSETTL